MNYERVFLVLCVTILAVAFLNAIIYVGFRHDKSSARTVEMFRRAAHRANNPWEDENDSLSELNQLVSQLETSNKPVGESEKKDGS